MTERVAQLCRRLEPILSKQIKQLWKAYQADPDLASRTQIEHMLEMLAQQHLGLGFQPDRSPFVPPRKAWAQGGELPVGEVVYAGKRYCDFNLELDRLTEHVLVCGRSGSGKSTLTLHLARGLMQRGVVVTAFDWKRSYRDLLRDVPAGELRVRTPGRSLAPFFWNPLIPPPGTDPVLYAKLIVDVISRALLGGDGVISLLHRGILALYKREGVGTDQQQRWPTIHDLLEWLESTKLTGRAAMWKQSAQRILMALTLGGIGEMVDTQSSADILALLDTHHVLELDGLAGSADRQIFAEGVTLWLSRYLLHRGERRHTERVWIHEEAHHLLGQTNGNSGAGGESVVEQNLRMARAYGCAYIIVDQTASMLSKTVFSNTGTVFALSQKLRSDVQAIAGAMNLDEAQRQAISTLPVGTAIARVPDGHPEPFLVRIPPPNQRQRHVTDEEIGRAFAQASPAPPPTVEDDIVRLLKESKSSNAGSPHHTSGEFSRTDSGDSASICSDKAPDPAITAIPLSEKTPVHPLSPLTRNAIHRPNPTHPPSQTTVSTGVPNRSTIGSDTDGLSNNPTEQGIPPSTPRRVLSDTGWPQEVDAAQSLAIQQAAHGPAAKRLLTDLLDHPLSTTVERYTRLHLSRRKGHDLRTILVKADLVRPVRIPTRSGNVVLLELTQRGRQHCLGIGLSLPATGHTGIAHRYWARRVAQSLKGEGYTVRREYQVEGNGRVDLLARKGDMLLPCEIETGLSDIKTNVANALKHFEKVLIVATSPEAIQKCTAIVDQLPAAQKGRVEIKSWLDYS